MANLADLLARSASRFPDRPALRSSDEVMTYSAFQQRAEEFAAFLASRGLRFGDRVILALRNDFGFPAAFFGALSAGAIVVPLNPLLRARETTYYLEDSGARFVIAERENAPGVVEAAEERGVCVIAPHDVHESRSVGTTGAAAVRTDDATAVILYTSGTTGHPKGAELTHFNLASNSHTYATEIVRAGSDDTLAGYLPLFHVFGLTCGLLTATQVGASLSLVSRFDAAQVLSLMDRHDVSVFAGVPTMYVALLEELHGKETALPALRLCVSGGAALPGEIVSQVEARLAAPLLEGYGLSESSAVTAFNRLDLERKVGSIGLPIPGMRMRLTDDRGVLGADQVGEIEIQGEGVMKRYWNRPAETEAAFSAGWFRTGDLATRDPEGYYTIIDRKKSVIIRAGYNVYPREIEEVLYEHPEIVEAAVVGIPDSRLGEEIGAAVVVRNADGIDLGALRAFVSERLAPYKYPRRFWVVDALPKGPSGKILRRSIDIPESVRAPIPANEATLH